MYDQNDHRLVSFPVRAIVRLSVTPFTRRFPSSFASSISRSDALLALTITRHNSKFVNVNDNDMHS